MSSQIIICPYCKGQGSIEIPDNRGTYDIINCDSCLGSGRLIQTIKTRPFEDQK